MLTVGRETFSGDLRFSVSLQRQRRRKLNSNWSLRITPTVQADDGTYVCQVSTHPPILLVAHLRVIGELALGELRVGSMAQCFVTSLSSTRFDTYSCTFDSSSY